VCSRETGSYGSDVAAELGGRESGLASGDGDLGEAGAVVEDGVVEERSRVDDGVV
jgi:hypothetical protein